jgi:hypothetical protein
MRMLLPLSYLALIDTSPLRDGLRERIAATEEALRVWGAGDQPPERCECGRYIRCIAGLAGAPDPACRG